MSQPFRLIIAGSREFTHPKWREFLTHALTMFAESFEVDLANVELFSGGCRGIDMHGEDIARERGWTVRRFEPDWAQHGKAAGPMRNQAMLDAGADGCIIARLDDSRGSRDMQRRAEPEVPTLALVMDREDENGNHFDEAEGRWVGPA